MLQPHIFPPQAQCFPPAHLPEGTASFLLGVPFLHPNTSTPFSDVSSGFSGFPPMLKAPPSSSQELDAILTSINSFRGPNH